MIEKMDIGFEQGSHASLPIHGVQESLKTTSENPPHPPQKLEQTLDEFRSRNVDENGSQRSIFKIIVHRQSRQPG